MQTSSPQTKKARQSFFVPKLNTPTNIGNFPSKAIPKKKEKKETSFAKRDATLLNDLTVFQISYLIEKITKDWMIVKCGQDESTWCYKTILLLDRRGGYPRGLRLSSQLSKSGTGRVEAKGVTYHWNAGGIILVATQRLALEEDIDVSHLCGHPWCVRPEHLIWEDPNSNIRRKECNTYTECPDCQHEFNPCKHDPKCIDMHECTCDWHRK